MNNALVVGTGKSGTTIVSSVIQSSIPGARLFLEPTRVAIFEKLSAVTGPRVVVKVLYDHWIQRPSLLSGIVRGETGFRPDRTVAIVRDPRDGLISVLMYSAYVHVAQGATREQVGRWIEVLREKEADPEKYSVLALIDKINGIFDTRYTPDWVFEAFKSYMVWLADNRHYLHVLRYEDFVEGKTAELAAYLGVEVSGSRDVELGYERVARSKASGDWRKMMLPDDVARWRDRYGAELEAYGYSDWELRSGRIDPVVSSDYVLRITDESFQRRLAERAGASPQSPDSGSGLSQSPIRRH
jgi:hypothetical protein